MGMDIAISGNRNEKCGTENEMGSGNKSGSEKLEKGLSGKIVSGNRNGSWWKQKQNYKWKFKKVEIGAKIGKCGSGNGSGSWKMQKWKWKWKLENVEVGIDSLVCSCNFLIRLKILKL